MGLMYRLSRLFRAAPASPAEPERDPPPARAPRKSAGGGAQVRRASPAEWDRTLPDERRMWAIMAAEYGRMVKDLSRPRREKVGDLREGGRRLTAEDIERLEANGAYLIARHARRAGTCAGRALGDVDDRPRVHASLTDGVAWAAVQRLQAREQARKTGPRFDWLKWFAGGRGVLWAYSHHAPDRLRALAPAPEGSAIGYWNDDVGVLMRPGGERLEEAPPEQLAESPSGTRFDRHGRRLPG